MNTIQETDKYIEKQLKTLELDYSTFNGAETIKYNVESLVTLKKKYESGKLPKDMFERQSRQHKSDIDSFIIQGIKDQLSAKEVEQMEKVDNSISMFDLGEMVYKARKNIYQTFNTSLKALTWNEVVNTNLKEKDYILEPLIREKDILMLYAPRGVGKTFVSTGIAWAISSGTEFLGWKAKEPKKTLFVDGEMALISMRERMAKLSLGLSNSNLKILSRDTLLEDQLLPDLSTVNGQEALNELTDWADFIVLDNLATLCRTGQENTTEAWKLTQSWLLSLRSQGKTIVIVDHAGKNGSNRGASAKQDVLDTVISLKHPSDYESEQGARFIVNIEKNRNANPIESIEAHLVNDVWNISSAKENRDEQIISMLDDGMSQTDIADELGVNRSTVCRVKKKREAQLEYLKK